MLVDKHPILLHASWDVLWLDQRLNQPKHFMVTLIPASRISLARYRLILCKCTRIFSFAGSVNYPEDFSSPSSLSSQHQLCSPTAPIPVHRAPLSPMDPVQYRSDSRRSSTSSVSSVGKSVRIYYYERFYFGCRLVVVVRV